MERHWSMGGPEKKKYEGNTVETLIVSSRKCSLRDQLQDLDEVVHPLRLTALVINTVSRMYEAVRELHQEDDEYSLDQIQSTMYKIFHRKTSDISNLKSGARRSICNDGVLQSYTLRGVWKPGLLKFKCCLLLGIRARQKKGSSINGAPISRKIS